MKGLLALAHVSQCLLTDDPPMSTAHGCTHETGSILRATCWTSLGRTKGSFLASSFSIVSAKMTAAGKLQMISGQQEIFHYYNQQRAGGSPSARDTSQLQPDRIPSVLAVCALVAPCWSLPVKSSYSCDMHPHWMSKSRGQWYFQ
jgi:hypothetical protein